MRPFLFCLLIALGVVILTTKDPLLGDAVVVIGIILALGEK